MKWKSWEKLCWIKLDSWLVRLFYYFLKSFRWQCKSLKRKEEGRPTLEISFYPITYSVPRVSNYIIQQASHSIMASSEPCITSFFERKKYLDAMAYFLCKGEELYLCAGIIKIFVCVCVYVTLWMWMSERTLWSYIMFPLSTFTQVLGIKLRSPRLVWECLTTEPPQSPRTYF